MDICHHYFINGQIPVAVNCVTNQREIIFMDKDLEGNPPVVIYLRVQVLD